MNTDRVGILKNYSLKRFNTFGIDNSAKYFVQISDITSLQMLLRENAFQNKEILILGGGSNILFTQTFSGLVIKNNIKGIKVLHESDQDLYIKTFSGEIWHDLVLYCVEKNYQGIENLSLIPGTVGAAPIQNIGAYGTELTDVFTELEALDLQTGELKVFNKEACHFGYRSSVFKNELKGKYFILSVTLKLNKIPHFNISYGAIQDILQQNGVQQLSVKAISDAVIHIRQSKLPDPAKIGNAGSFFKNPEIDILQYEELKNSFPHIPGYKTDDKKVKVPAGWLIEQCGWKGKRVGNTGAHKDQALVLVNYGGALGHEIYSLAIEIKTSVFEKFKIELNPEVNII